MTIFTWQELILPTFRLDAAVLLRANETRLCGGTSIRWGLPVRIVANYPLLGMWCFCTAPVFSLSIIYLTWLARWLNERTQSKTRGQVEVASFTRLSLAFCVRRGCPNKIRPVLTVLVLLLDLSWPSMFLWWVHHLRMHACNYASTRTCMHATKPVHVHACMQLRQYMYMHACN